MKTLVLDKSALRAANRDGITVLRKRFDFLLTDTLIHEIATEGVEEREELSHEEEDRLDKIIDATSAKTIGCAGDSCIMRGQSMRWEIEQGSSAKFGPRFSTQAKCMSDYLTPEVLKRSAEYDIFVCKKMLDLGSSIDSLAYGQIKCKKERELFLWFSVEQCSDKWNQWVSCETRKLLIELGKKYKFQAAEKLDPDRGWLLFGVTLTFTAMRFLIAWRHGRQNSLSVNKKLIKDSFDTLYITYMAIADGILSADKKQLKLAWALWPEKRESIYEYNQATHKAEVFEPKWKS